MRRRLLAAASLASVMAAPAYAQETVDGERTEPINTSTASGGSPADIVIGANGRVVLEDPGPAVTLDSDNSVTIENGGEILIENVDGATGVVLTGGSTGDFTSNGRIAVLEDYTASDSGTDLEDIDGDGVADEEDGDADGPFSEGVNRTGVAIVGVDPFTGGVVFDTQSSLRVFGQDSYGVRVQAPLVGDFTFAGDGLVRGERSRVLSFENTVTGDILVDGRLQAVGPDSQGVVIEGDVEGGVRFAGSLTANGYRVSSRVSQQLFEILDEGDDNLPSGSAVLIEGSIRDGVFFDGPEGVDGGANVGGNGVEPTVVIRPGEAAASDLTLGEVVAPGGVDEDGAELPDEPRGRGFVNDGTIQADSIFDGQESTALLIAGRDVSGTLRAVVIEGGFENTGTIQSRAYDADTTAVVFGAGATAEVIDNQGVITAGSAVGLTEDGFGSDDPVEAVTRAVVIEAGAEIQSLINSGSILVNTQLGGEATAIVVASNTLTSIENTNRISATGADLQFDEDGEVLFTPERIAIDASAQTTGLTVTQRAGAEDDAPTPSIVGDIRFGSGADTLSIEAGTVTGDVFFGDGADRLILRDATLDGSINDSDGDLSVDAERATIGLVGDETLTLTDARFGDGAVLDITVDESSPAASGFFLDASGSVSFEQGSDLSISLANVLGETNTFNIISAGSLSIADEEAVLGLADSPYLYEATLERDVSDPDVIVLNLRRRSASELGLSENQANAYDSTLGVLDRVETLGAAFAQLREQDEFLAAYDQLLPNYSDGALQFALANNDAAQGALATRLRNARLAPDELAGIWVQEFGYYADRGTTTLMPGYRGQGFGVAMGLDRPLGPFYAVGVNFVAAASEIEEIDGFDEPLTALSAQIGAYAALDLAGFDASFAGSVGYDDYESERRILIGSFDQIATADWSGWHASASANIGRDVTLGDWVVRPEAALTYLTLTESDYQEEDGGTGFGLLVDERETSLATAAANLSVARRFGSDYSWWMPYLRAGYRGELSEADTETVARFGETGERFTLRSDQIPGTGLLLGFGLSAGSNYSTFTFAYDADVRDDFIRHVGRVVIRITF